MDFDVQQRPQCGFQTLSWNWFQQDSGSCSWAGYYSCCSSVQTSCRRDTARFVHCANFALSLPWIVRASSCFNFLLGLQNFWTQWRTFLRWRSRLRFCRVRKWPRSWRSSISRHTILWRLFQRKTISARFIFYFVYDTASSDFENRKNN